MCIRDRLKTSGTRHVVGNLITATYVTIAVARILVVSIWFSPAGDCKEKSILSLSLYTNKSKLLCLRSIIIIIIVVVVVITIIIIIIIIIIITTIIIKNCYRHQQYHCRYKTN